MRIKRVAAALLAALMLLSLPLTAFAAPPRLVDDANLLTESEQQRLLQTLDEISERQDFDVVVVTVEDIGQKSPMEYADDYYDYNGYRTDGVLLLVSMAERDWYVSTTGYGITAITDAGIDDLSDRFLPYLSSGDYYEAFRTFANRCDRLVTMARDGAPYDPPKQNGGSHSSVTHTENDVSDEREPFPLVEYLLMALLLGAISSLITVSVMRGKLKSVRPQSAAANYMRPGSMRITESRDLFLYTKTTRRAKPQDTNSGGGHSGGGGSSVHTSSSGTTHGGGGGKF